MAKSLKGVWLISLCLLLAACGSSNSTIETPQAIDGQLDLTGWDFKNNGTVNLSGQWAFYWQEFIYPNQISNTSNFQYVPAPAVWTEYEINDQALPPEGFATFHLTVQVPDPSQIYALFISGEGTAYTLWIDNVEVAQNGRVAKNKQNMIAERKPQIVFFQPTGASVDLVIQISNFHHRKAGLRNEITMGLPDQVHEHHRDERAKDAFTLGIFLAMSIYHIFIYILRPKDTGPLYFALWSFFSFIRAGVLDQKLLLFIFDMSWELTLKLEYFTFYFSGPIYAVFIQSLYPKDVDKWVVRAMTGLSVIFSIPLLFLDTLTLSNTISAYQVIIFIEIIYFVFFIGKIVKNKRDGALYVTVASLIGFAGVILEVLYLQGISPIPFDSSLTFLGFIMVQAIFLSSRISNSFQRVEALSRELKETNANLSESEKKYRAIFEESKDMVFIASLDEQFEDVNPASEEILGYTRTELKNMKLSDLVVHQQDRQKIEKTLRGDEIVRDYELELKKKNGDIIHGLATLTLRRDENNAVVEIQGRIQNIDAMKQAEAEKYRAMVFQQLAITDPLTNIYNRRVFDEIALKEWERAKRTKSPLAIVLFDVDHFKQVNDTYGHLVGDQILISLAKLCSDNLRSMDIYARYGGEEFVILMPDTASEAAYQSMERLRTTIETTPAGTYENTDLFITVSMGVVIWDGEGSLDIRALLSRADQALYTSKESGRNRTTLWKKT